MPARSLKASAISRIDRLATLTHAAGETMNAKTRCLFGFTEAARCSRSDGSRSPASELGDFKSAVGGGKG
jgi:hypothetical protein